MLLKTTDATTKTTNSLHGHGPPARPRLPAVRQVMRDARYDELEGVMYGSEGKGPEP